MIPFTRRTSTSVAVFAAIFAASPQGAQMYANNTTQLGSLALSYAQLVATYRTLLDQDQANNEVVLDANIATAVTQLTALNATMQSITPTVALQDSFTLAHLQLVVYNGLQQATAAQNAAGDTE